MLKRKITIILCMLFILSIIGCTSNGDKNLSSINNITEEAFNRAISYYPVGVDFQFIQQVKLAEQEVITGPLYQDVFIKQDFRIYDVVFEDRKVSGIAIGVEDGSIWIYDIYLGNWFYERFMGLPQRVETEVVVREPVIEILRDGSLYFAGINTIPELSDRNEGGAYWNEEEKTITIRAVKGTGSVTGAIDGPGIKIVVTWANGEPELIDVKYQPAPAFSHPREVLYSGEMMNIKEERLIEIAEYFRILIRE